MGDANLSRDLWGNLRAMPSGGRGRPSHCWSQENENRVLLGLAMDYRDAEIASGLGISVPTLRKHYFSALKRRDMQRMQFELWRAEILANEANAGNVTAIRELAKLMDKRDRLRAMREHDGAEKAPRKAPVLGKKERAQEQAGEDLQSGWDGDLLPGNWSH